MARANLSDFRGQQFDFQKTYYWQLSLINPPRGNFFPLTDGKTLDMLCTSTDVPRYEGETALTMFKGYQVPDPGIYKPTSKLTLKFIERTDSPIRIGWDTWMVALRNKSDTFYNTYGDFCLTTTDNQGGDSYQYNLLWCFPDATEPQELDSDNSNPMNFSVTLRFTDVRIGARYVPADAQNLNAPG